MFFDFSLRGMPPFDPANSPPQVHRGGIKGGSFLLSLILKPSFLHARDLTRPRPQGPGELFRLILIDVQYVVFDVR